MLKYVSNKIYFTAEFSLGAKPFIQKVKIIPLKKIICFFI